MKDFTEIMNMIHEEIDQSNKLHTKTMILWDNIDEEPELVRVAKNECIKQIQRIRNQLSAIEDEINGV